MIRCTLFSCSQRDLIMNRLVSGWRFFVFWLLGSAIYACFMYISGKDAPWWLLVFGIVALGMDWRARNGGWISDTSGSYDSECGLPTDRHRSERHRPIH